MNFVEDGHRIEIWTEISQFDGMAIIQDLPGNPVRHDPTQITVHIDVAPPPKIDTIEAPVTISSSKAGVGPTE